MWARCGSRPTQVKQTEYKWVYLMAAVNPRTGDSLGLIAPTVNTDVMNIYLRMLSEHVGSSVQVVLILDQAGWHVAKRLAVPDNITLLHLPPYSPELNPVERLWCWMKTHDLSNRAYADHDALYEAGCAAWNRLTPQRIQSLCASSWLRSTD